MSVSVIEKHAWGKMSGIMIVTKQMSTFLIPSFHIPVSLFERKGPVRKRMLYNFDIFDLEYLL